MLSSEMEIAEAARKFESLERDFLKYTYETSKPSTNDGFLNFFKKSLHIAEQAYQTKQQIVESFCQAIEIRVSDQIVQNVLENIRNDEPFYSITFYENMIEALKEDDSIKDSLPNALDIVADLIDKKWDSLFEDFHSWFSINNYFYAKMKIGPVISSFKVPKHLIVYFNEIRETFAFEQYRAATALCRALLEMCLYQKLNAKKAFSSRSSKTVVSLHDAKEDSICKYINMARSYRLLSDNEIDTAHEIRKAANKILHVQESPSLPTEADTLNIIRNTVAILQRLYK